MKDCLQALTLLAVGLVSVGLGGEPRKPAILFCSPQGVSYGWLDLAYAAELHKKGFEVDYTESLAELTAERIRRYNVLVIYITPDAYEVTMLARTSSPGKARAFADLVDSYVASGGGVLLMPTETNILKQAVSDLADRFGAKLPVERIEESDKSKLGHLLHCSHGVPLAFTDQVLPSPVSEGVKQIWYPIQHAYNAQQTGPIVVDENWQVVVKASKTAVTRPVDLAKSTSPVLANAFWRTESVAEPALFAIRSYRAGRIALVNQWRQFSVGSGTKYIFDRQVLSKGFGGRGSDFGRLLENTFRWLAEPSLARGVPGGYVTPPERLQPPNQDPKVRKQYADRTWPYDTARLSQAAPPGHLKIFRGLIGAKTAYTSGRSSVEQYARAARTAKLDFLVFMDDFDQLTPQKLQSLKEDCLKHSSPALRLLPGFSIQNNIGNRMFFYSPDPAWIPEYCLTGPDKKVLYIQEEDGKGGYTGFLTPFLDWVLGAYHVDKGQVGYYHFAASPHGMRMHDLRLYAMAAVRYYRAGRLVEDNTDAYLTTAQCTIPPAPASVNEVASDEELLRELSAGNALVYAQARSLDTLFLDALRWTHQYDAPNVFMSDGPVVECWPSCYRVSTLGAEEFVTGVSVMPAPLAVVSDRGLKEVRLYDGQNLFRRFLPNGARQFRQTLVLEGTIQRNIVLVAEDMAGKKAVTFARRCWKDGSLAVSFCSDHVNDGTMALTHGPYSYPLIRHPSLPADIAGDTWDGGPVAALPLTGNQDTVPVLESDRGSEDGHRFDQIPLLEFADEGAMAVASPRLELFDQRLQRIVNPWHTYGPIAGPSRLMHYTQRYAEWLPPTVGVPQTGWAGPGVRVGTNASLLRNEVTFRQEQTIKSLGLGYFTGNQTAILVINREGATQEVPLSEPGKYQRWRLRRGDWFGYYSTKPANTNVFFVRGEPVQLENRAPYVFFWADRQDARVSQGQTLSFEFSAIGIPVNVEVRSLAELQRYVEYLKAPTGMQILRGTRLDTAGLLELSPDAGFAVELVLPRPPRRLELTVPCRIVGLNPRWSAGLFQRKGYVKGDYGSGENRYRALGLDLAGNAYVPLYVDLADVTHAVRLLVALLEGPIDL